MIVLPIYWVKTYKTKPDKTVLVGLNWYRNAHYYDQNKLKRDFHALIKSQIPTDTILSTYKLSLKLYYKNSVCDGANICAMMEKIVLDALQEYGITKQDNVKFHLGTTWTVEGQDKENPRCEITIEEVV